MVKKVILSSPLMIGIGTFKTFKLREDEAILWANGKDVTNFCGHQTVKVLGIEPAKTRETCTSYDEALCISTKKRLDFGREYSENEIKEIGVDFMLVVFERRSTPCQCGSGQANDMCNRNDQFCW